MIILFKTCSSGIPLRWAKIDTSGVFLGHVFSFDHFLSSSLYLESALNMRCVHLFILFSWRSHHSWHLVQMCCGVPLCEVWWFLSQVMQKLSPCWFPGQFIRCRHLCHIAGYEDGVIYLLVPCRWQVHMEVICILSSFWSWSVRGM